jgi:hypothetical protein
VASDGRLRTRDVRAGGHRGLGLAVRYPGQPIIAAISAAAVIVAIAFAIFRSW